jgi:hypothetical protein
MADYRRAEAILTSPLPPSRLPQPLTAGQVGRLLDEEHDPTALPGCELENPSAAGNGSRSPLRSRGSGLNFAATPATGSKHSFSSQDHSCTIPSRRPEILLGRTPKLNMASYDMGPTGQQAVVSQAGPVIDSSMACRYLATLSLVCLLPRRFCKSSFLSVVAPREAGRGAVADWRIKSICIDGWAIYLLRMMSLVTY